MASQNFSINVFDAIAKALGGRGAAGGGSGSVGQSQSQAQQNASSQAEQKTVRESEKTNNALSQILDHLKTLKAAKTNLEQHGGVQEADYQKYWDSEDVAQGALTSELTKFIRSQGIRASEQDVAKLPELRKMMDDPNSEKATRLFEQAVDRFDKSTGKLIQHRRSGSSLQGGTGNLLSTIQTVLGGSAIYSGMASGDLLATASGVANLASAYTQRRDRLREQHAREELAQSNVSDELQNSNLGRAANIIDSESIQSALITAGTAVFTAAIAALSSFAKEAYGSMERTAEAGRVLYGNQAMRGLGSTSDAGYSSLYTPLQQSGRMVLTQQQRSQVEMNLAQANLRTSGDVTRLINVMNRNFAIFGQAADKMNVGMSEILKYSYTKELPEALDRSLQESSAPYAAENYTALAQVVSQLMRQNPTMDRERLNLITGRLAELQNRYGMYGEAPQIMQDTQSAARQVMNNPSALAALQLASGASLEQISDARYGRYTFNDDQYLAMWQQARAFTGSDSYAQSYLENMIGAGGAARAFRISQGKTPEQDRQQMGDQDQYAEGLRNFSKTFEVITQDSELQLRRNVEIMGKFGDELAKLTVELKEQSRNLVGLGRMAYNGANAVASAFAPPQLLLRMLGLGSSSNGSGLNLEQIRN
jgi:hypothetical protein